jgi:predicted DNA binding CopG/RHH family protein
MSKKPDSKQNEYLENTELWENKQLGASKEHAKRASVEDDKALDDDLGLAPISLRLQKEVVARLKTLAKQDGLGYQTYIRQVLTRHVRGAVTDRPKRESA